MSITAAPKRVAEQYFVARRSGAKLLKDIGLA
jgi:hypothetical protein